MKRYAAAQILRCRTICCLATLDVTGKDLAETARNAGWTRVTVDVNRYLAPDPEAHLCRACSEKAAPP